MKNIIDYSLILTSHLELSKRLLEIKGEVVRLVFFQKCKDNKEYADLYEEFKAEARRIWGERRPLVSFVAQQTLNAELVVEVHSVEGELKYTNYELTGGRCISVAQAFGKMYFVGELQKDVLTASIEEQANAVFDAARVIFKDKGCEYNNIVRQWNYIERITECEGENQHYQLFNNARSSFYAECEWPNGYPAATGIGTDWGGIAVDMDVIIPNESCKITAIDNKLQIAAHTYSEGVLIDANCNKSTPKFERAKSVEAEGFAKITYVSGTAAIRGEVSYTGYGIAAQTVGTLENIDQLIDSRKDIKLLRAYVKHKTDWGKVEELINTCAPNVPTAYLIADVCREELLVEIEGIAIRKETTNFLNK